MGNHDWVLVFRVSALSFGSLIILYLVGKSFLSYVGERVEIAVGGKIQELCSEFTCSPFIFRVALADILQENNILRAHMDAWKSTRLPSVIVALFLIKWVEEHKGLFIPFVENTKKSVQSFISHLEKVTEEME